MMETKEEAFFGVKNTIEAPAESTEETELIDVEIVNDMPEEDQAHVGEVKSVKGSTEQRIKKLKWEYHEERRAKEQAQRMSEEAVQQTERLHSDNQRLVEIVRKSQEAINNQSTQRAEADIRFAQEQYKKALASDDHDAIVEAQKSLTDAQMDRQGADQTSSQLIGQWVGEMEPAPQRHAPPPEPQNTQMLEPDPKAVEWQKDNQWFGADEEMTSLAYGIHDKLVREGIDPDSDQYYNSIDERMREVFPSHFNGSVDNQQQENVVVDIAQPQKAHPVVAPARRGSKGAPRKITLTETQARLAKRLGLSPQQYAAQLLKELS